MKYIIPKTGYLKWYIEYINKSVYFDMCNGVNFG